MKFPEKWDLLSGLFQKKGDGTMGLTNHYSPLFITIIQLLFHYSIINYQTIITIIITGYNHYQPLLTTINSWLPSHSNPCDGNGNGSGNLWIVGCGSVIVQVAEN
jgi:hypothetical protein